MKTWKLVTAITLAVIAVALITASVFAYMGGQGFNSPYGTYQYGNYPQYPTLPNSTTPITPVYPPQHRFIPLKTFTHINSDVGVGAAPAELAGMVMLDHYIPITEPQ